MAKFDLKIKARKMRSKGASVKEIAKKLGISKSTCSLWVRDIILSIHQLEKLRERAIKGGERGRLKGALMQKQRRLDIIKQWEKNGVRELCSLSKRDLYIAGIALYWAEGCKKNRGTQVFNSDPELIKLMVGWFRIFFGIKTEDIKARVGLNEAHKSREEIVKKYWSKITGIPLNQFTKTRIKKVKNKKIYKNFNDHYGTLSISILKPTKYCYRILGLIKGLSQAGSRLVSRGVS